MTALPRLEGVRLSSLAKCARWSALQAIGAPEMEPLPEWENYLARGQVFEQVVAAQYQVKYGRGNVQRQRVIPWGDGWEGHADLYLVKDRWLVEVVSTVAPHSGLLADKIRQARAYLHFDPEAENASVHVVNPSTLRRDEAFPVILTEESVEEIEARVAAVKRAIKTKGDDLPACSSCTPMECRMRGCPYTAEAWADWEAPLPGLLDGEARALAHELYVNKLAIKERKTLVAEAEKERATLRAALRDFGLRSGGDYLAGGVRVRRTEVAGRETYDVERAIEAGIVTAAMMEPFRRVGDPYDVWTVTRNGDEPLETEATVEDFGGVPF
jgi:hypothetical protein